MESSGQSYEHEPLTPLEKLERALKAANEARKARLAAPTEEVTFAHTQYLAAEAAATEALKEASEAGVADQEIEYLVALYSGLHAEDEPDDGAEEEL